MAAALAIGVGAFMLFRYLGKTGGSIGSFGARTTDGGSKPSMKMFYADWCGHCQAAKPKFEPLLGVSELDGKPVSFEMINAEKQSDVASEYGVKAYPTFVFESASGQREEYTGERDMDKIKSFMQARI